MASGLPMASRGVARGANYLGDVLTQATRAAPPAAPMRGLEKTYAEAEQRIAGLVEPQAGAKPPEVSKSLLDNPNLKNWAKGSEAVKESGEPITLYHT
jgi:hypothetical protein